MLSEGSLVLPLFLPSCPGAFARAWPSFPVEGQPARALPPGGVILDVRVPLFPPRPFPSLCLQAVWDPRVRGRRGCWRRLSWGWGAQVPAGRGSSLPWLLSSPRSLLALGGPPRREAWSAGVALSGALGDPGLLSLALGVMGS